MTTKAAQCPNQWEALPACVHTASSKYQSGLARSTIRSQRIALVTTSRLASDLAHLGQPGVMRQILTLNLYLVLRSGADARRIAALWHGYKFEGSKAPPLYLQGNTDASGC